MPNEYLKTQLLKLLKKQNRQYKSYIQNGCRDADKIRLDNFREECFKTTEKCQKQSLDMGKRLVENQSSSKAYWKILSKHINKANIPRIPSNSVWK